VVSFVYYIVCRGNHLPGSGAAQLDVKTQNMKWVSRG